MLEALSGLAFRLKGGLCEGWNQLISAVDAGANSAHPEGAKTATETELAIKSIGSRAGGFVGGTVAGAFKGLSGLSRQMVTYYKSDVKGGEELGNQSSALILTALGAGCAALICGLSEENTGWNQFVWTILMTLLFNTLIGSYAKPMLKGLGGLVGRVKNAVYGAVVGGYQGSKAGAVQGFKAGSHVGGFCTLLGSKVGGTSLKETAKLISNQGAFLNLSEAVGSVAAPLLGAVTLDYFLPFLGLTGVLVGSSLLELCQRTIKKYLPEEGSSAAKVSQVASHAVIGSLFVNRTLDGGLLGTTLRSGFSLCKSVTYLSTKNNCSFIRSGVSLAAHSLMTVGSFGLSFFVTNPIIATVSSIVLYSATTSYCAKIQKKAVDEQAKKNEESLRVKEAQERMALEEAAAKAAPAPIASEPTAPAALAPETTFVVPDKPPVAPAAAPNQLVDKGRVLASKVLSWAPVFVGAGCLCLAGAYLYQNPVNLSGLSDILNEQLIHYGLKLPPQKPQSWYNKIFG